MKILVICQHYYPEPFRISDICEELAARGHELTVVTGTPNYPMGEIYEGYRSKENQDEIINGVTVHRCKIHPRKTGNLHRLWNYYSYPHASKKYVSRLDGSFDVVFINQLSPVMMAQAGIKYAKKHNKKTVTYCLDMWPASLSAGGIKSGPVYKWFYRESKKTYRSLDKILVASKSFSEYFKNEFGICNTVYLPQYAEEIFTPERCKKEPDGYFDFMFAGNIGIAQSVGTVIKAAALCKDIPNIRWHIVGDGKELKNIKKLATALEVPVIFHGRKPLQEMPKYYAMADAMLVTMQKNSALSLTLPGKVQSYMAAGKPIIGAIDGEAPSVLAEHDCGICGEAENEVQLSENIRYFVQNHATLAEKFSRNALKAYRESFLKSNFIDTLEASFFDSTKG